MRKKGRKNSFLKKENKGRSRPLDATSFPHEHNPFIQILLNPILDYIPHHPQTPSTFWAGLMTYGKPLYFLSRFFSIPQGLLAAFEVLPIASEAIPATSKARLARSAI